MSHEEDTQRSSGFLVVASGQIVCFTILLVTLIDVLGFKSIVYLL